MGRVFTPTQEKQSQTIERTTLPSTREAAPVVADACSDAACALRLTTSSTVANRLMSDAGSMSGNEITFDFCLRHGFCSATPVARPLAGRSRRLLTMVCRGRAGLKGWAGLRLQAEGRSNVRSLLGATPKHFLYSRLNCEALAYPVANAIDVTLLDPDASSRRASRRRM